MSLLPLFVNPKFDVRSGWKFGAYSLLLVILFLVTGTALGMFVVWLAPDWLLMPRSDIRFLGLNAIVLLIPSVLSMFLMARFDHIPIAAFGVAIHERWLRDFGAGLILSGGMLGIILVLALFFGNAAISLNSGALSTVALTFGVLFISAANEELVFRGYPFQILMKGIGPWGATLVLSTIWGLLHARNEDATALGVVNTIIAGVFFCRAYMETRSLWLPFGIHIGWNAGTSVLLGLPVSGIDTVSLLKTDVAGPDSIFGGSYGPEGGILVTLLFLAGAVFVRRVRIGKVSPQIQAALAANADKLYVEEL